MDAEWSGTVLLSPPSNVWLPLSLWVNPVLYQWFHVIFTKRILVLELAA